MGVSLEGAITSALIVAVCFAGLHSIVDMRREQARRLGVPYMDSGRRAALIGAAAIFGCYVLFIALVGS